MTKDKLRQWVRREFEAHPGNLQGIAAVRVLGVPVFAWDVRTTDELLRLLASMRAVSLIAEVSP